MYNIKHQLWHFAGFSNLMIFLLSMTAVTPIYAVDNIEIRLKEISTNFEHHSKNFKTASDNLAKLTDEMLNGKKPNATVLNKEWVVLEKIASRLSAMTKKESTHVLRIYEARQAIQDEIDNIKEWARIVGEPHENLVKSYLDNLKKLQDEEVKLEKIHIAATEMHQKLLKQKIWFPYYIRVNKLNEIVTTISNATDGLKGVLKDMNPFIEMVKNPSVPD
jgi:hypothetical protein